MDDYYEVDPRECYDNAAIPEIENQFIVEYEDDGKVHKMTFPVFEGDSMEKVLQEAVAFSSRENGILLYAEIGSQFYNPKTGEMVETPFTGWHCKDYYRQPEQPYEKIRYGFTAVEPDELPF